MSGGAFERVVVASPDVEWREPVGALLATRAIAVETAADVFDAVARARRGSALVLLHAFSADDVALAQRGLNGVADAEVVRVVPVPGDGEGNALVFDGRLVAFVDAVESRARGAAGAAGTRGAAARLAAARTQSYHAILGVRLGCQPEEVAEALRAALADIGDAPVKDGEDGARAEMRALLLEAADVLSVPAARALYELGLSGR